MKNLAFLICSLLLFQKSYAQLEETNPILSDRFLVEAGVFIPSRVIKLGADGSSPNDKIDFSESFDFKDNQSTPFFLAEWRFSKKWKVAVEYFSVNNANRLTLDRDIVFEDITFEKGSFVRGGVEFNLIRVFFGRQLLMRE